MVNKKSRFEHGKRPSAISPPPRDSKHGRVLAEVGVFEEGTGMKNYWKVIQRLETDYGSEVRPAYYVGSDGDWNWGKDPVRIPPIVYSELHARAVTAGILVE